MNIPNLLTVYRLIAALIVGWPFLIFPESFASGIAFIIFVSAALTDFLDGYLARKWNQVSEIGRMLDPIADKVMVLMMLCVLNSVVDLDWRLLAPTTLIIFREILVSGMREFLGDRAKALKVTKLAKWKTASQMVSISLMLFAHALHWSMIFNLGAALFWVSMLLTVVTGVDYARKTIALLEH